ncbi:MAG: hypothetical protein GY807_24340 [Gammaproteobacteria bacterium]|nr:hypothetical protein [Gammaproteobacteria bacterium]
MATAGFLASLGCDVRLFNRTPARIQSFLASRRIELNGRLNVVAELALVSSDLRKVVRGAEIIIVTVTADAHGDMAMSLAELLEDDQVVLLHPGRTGGALEFKSVLQKMHCRKHVRIAESQSLVFACRSNTPGIVTIIGQKQYLPIAAFPRSDTDEVLKRLAPLFPCMVKAENVLQTSFENIGAVLHPVIFVFNMAAIKRGESFHFYRDMTVDEAAVIAKVDNERLTLGRAYGMELLSITEWIRKSYPGSPQETLCDLVRSNPAYADIIAPTAIRSRYLFEDLPMGLVPFCTMAAIAGIRLPLSASLVRLGGALLGEDYFASGRTPDRMGLAGLDITTILEKM